MTEIETEKLENTEELKNGETEKLKNQETGEPENKEESKEAQEDKTEILNHELKADENLFTKISGLLKKVGLFELGDKIFSSNKKKIKKNLSREEELKRDLEEAAIIAEGFDLPTEEHSQENLEIKDKKEELSKFLFEDFLLINKFFPKEILSLWINLDKKPSRELLARSAKSGDIAYASPETNNITFMEKFWHMLENGQEYDRPFTACHELGHMLDFNHVFHSKEQKIVLNKIAGGLETASLTDDERKMISPEMNDILELFRNPDNAAKETKYVQKLLGNLANNETMKEFMAKHNETSSNKVKTIEDYKKIYRADIAQEVLADRASSYMLAKDKSPLGMLKERLARTPDAIKYLEMDDKSAKVFIETMKKMKTEEIAPDKMSDALKEAGITLNQEKFTELYKENQRFFELFDAQLGKKTPEEVKAMINTKKLSQEELDDLDDLFDYAGGGYGGYGEGASMGASRGQEKGFIDAIFEFFELLFKSVPNG